MKKFGNHGGGLLLFPTTAGTSPVVPLPPPDPLFVVVVVCPDPLLVVVDVLADF